MGGGTYSSARRADNISLNTSYAAFGVDKTKSAHEAFKERAINNAMSPYGVKIRESRDSDEHPNSLAIMIALDETGSMGSVPHYLVKSGLPDFMDSIIKGGIADPQVLFLGIGDHECDEAPLQVGQFESSDELMDHWLTKLYIEGHGGGNDGESYLLAWYFAAKHTSVDCFEKRNDKGFLFTIGDEPTLKSIPSGVLRNLMGDGQYDNANASELLIKASETYNVYHLHVQKETINGGRQDVIDGWKQLLNDRLILVERKEDVPQTIADIIVNNKNGQVSTPKQLEHKSTKSADESEMML